MVEVEEGQQGCGGENASLRDRRLSVGVRGGLEVGSKDDCGRKARRGSDVGRRWIFPPLMKTEMVVMVALVRSLSLVTVRVK